MTQNAAWFRSFVHDMVRTVFRRRDGGGAILVAAFDLEQSPPRVVCDRGCTYASSNVDATIEMLGNLLAGVEGMIEDAADFHGDDADLFAARCRDLADVAKANRWSITEDHRPGGGT